MDLRQYLNYSMLDQKHLMCFNPSKITMNGIWTGENPFDFSLPILLFQLVLIISTTRALTLLLSPLGLPRYISEILGGFILGPSVLGRLPHFVDIVFPGRSIFILESMSLLGLVYYMFTVGVEIELLTITRAGVRSFWFATACAIPPFLVGAATGYVDVSAGGTGEKTTAGDNYYLQSLSFPIFLGATFSATAFSVLARNIAELKLAGTDIGQLTLSASLLNGTIAWVGLTVATALVQTRHGMLPSMLTVMSGVFIFAVSYLVVRPMLVWLARRASNGEEVGEVRECSLLIGVMVAALGADALGMHVIFGAFVFGLAVPNGPIGVALVEKVEDFVVGMLLPLFFAMNGLRTNTAKVTDMHAALMLMGAAMAAAVLKVVAAVTMAALFGMTLHDGTSIGLLLNTKGIIELIILNIAKSKKIMSDQSFTVLVFMSALITGLVSPLLAMVVKPARRLVFYKRRTIAWSHPEAELRVLACVHAPRDVPALFTLLDIVYPSKRSPVAVLALHLIELAGRASALFLINASAPGASMEAPTHGRSHLEMQSEHIAQAFMAYQEQAEGVSAHTMAAISPYASMHEDIIAAAEDRHAALMLLPFHKHRSVDGGMELAHQAIKVLNKNVQSFSPCTVGILVDRGLGAINGVGYHVTALFFGGRDDREVVAFATRMVSHPSIDLTVLRFVHKGSFSGIEFDTLKERKADDGCLREFMDRANEGGGAGVEYRECGVLNAREMVSEIQNVEASGKDLFVVGKVPGATALTAGMSDWCECPELGPIGDMLASEDFGTRASVLVLHAYRRGVGAMAVDGGSDSVMSADRREQTVRVDSARAQATA